MEEIAPVHINSKETKISEEVGSSKQPGSIETLESLSLGGCDAIMASIITGDNISHDIDNIYLEKVPFAN